MTGASMTGAFAGNQQNGISSFQGQGLSPGVWRVNLQQVVTGLPGRSYRLTYSAKQATANNCALVTTFDGTVLGGAAGFRPGVGRYTTVTPNAVAVLTAETGTLLFAISCSTGIASGRAWVDDVTLTLIPA